ncbi:hypothetical protein GN316_18515 [Xylophilus sp. Kf1]|nr:hypothetical protein [Xylophilus sp. Kf1]
MALLFCDMRTSSLNGCRPPRIQNQVDWTRLQDASDQWDYQQQGLTSVGAVIVTAAVAYFTFGAASGLGAAAGDAAAVGAGQGVALTGGGAFLTGSGAAIAGVVGGASTAALTALAAQAAIAVANNPTDPGKALKQLGSSANVRGLVAALLTGGVLAGLNLAPTGVPTAGAGAQAFGDQLWQNLRAGAARAVINTAVYGGSLEGALKAGLLASIVDTGAAQTAFAIGDLNLDAYTGKVAHALAGCAAGAARSGGSCQAGALGAVIGEISGEQFGFDDNGNIQPGAIEMASMLGAVGAALAGMDASEVALAAAAAGNAAANNALSHYVEKALGKLKNTLRSLELKPLADSQKAVSEYLDSAAARGGLNETEIAALGTLYALNEALFPTSVLDVAGPIGKAVGKAGRLIKAGVGAEEAASAAVKEVKTAAGLGENGGGKIAAEKGGFDNANLQSKLEGYLLDPAHPQNQTKAIWFQQALGFDKSNWQKLGSQITFNESTAIATKTTQYGQTFEQVIPITGANGKTIDVPFVFMKDNTGTVRLVTGIPTKK